MLLLLIFSSRCFQYIVLISTFNFHLFLNSIPRGGSGRGEKRGEQTRHIRFGRVLGQVSTKLGSAVPKPRQSACTFSQSCKFFYSVNTNRQTRKKKTALLGMKTTTKGKQGKE